MAKFSPWRKVQTAVVKRLSQKVIIFFWDNQKWEKFPNIGPEVGWISSHLCENMNKMGDIKKAGYFLVSLFPQARKGQT